MVEALAIEFRLLGDVAVVIDGRPADVGGVRQRSVLALLLLSRNRPINAEMMADRLWLHEQPLTATKTIQVYVSRLRKALGAHSGRLTTTRAGYLLAVAETELDSGNFEVLLDRARRDHGRVTYEEAIEAIEQALGLWKGPAFADLAGEAFARREAERLEELRFQAVEDLIGLRIRSRGGREVVAELRGILNDQPGRERLWGLLMLALYQDGRQSEALGAYHEARRHLDAELGIDPGPDLQDLERRILAQDPSLLDSQDASASSHLALTGLPASPPAGQETVRLPEAALDPLLGRSELLADITARVTRHRFVTLTGPGGTGKTRLARAVVDAARADREAVFVDVSGLTSGDGLFGLLAAFLHLPDRRGPTAAVGDWARSGSKLLGLDNLEQATGIGDHIQRLLSVAPDLHVLTTSRAPTRGPGEHEVQVPPLALPDEGSPDAVEAAPATALFLERARALGRLEGPIDREVAADIAALCSRLDGLPLAVELAAARTRILSPRAILRRLQDHGPGVLHRSHGDIRHRSLEAVLDWTLTLLSDDERFLLSACAVCAGTFDLDLLESLAPQVDAPASIESLVACGLVFVDDEVEGEPLFRLFESVRLVMIGRLGPEYAALQRRHAEAVAQRIARWEPQLETIEIRRAVSRLDADLDNIAAATGWSRSHDVRLAVRLTADAGTYWVTRGITDEPMRAMMSLVSTVPERSPERARLVAAITRLGSITGKQGEVRRFALEAVELGMALALPDVEIEGLVALADPSDRFLTGEPINEDLVRRALVLDPSGPRQREMVLRLRELIAERDNGAEAAASIMQEGLERARAEGAPRRIDFVANDLAHAMLSLGRWAEAISAADEAAAVAQSIGDIRIEMFALDAKAIALAGSGDLARSCDSMARALALAVALETPQSLATALQFAALIAAVAGRPLDAFWLSGAAQSAYAPDQLPGFDVAQDELARLWAANTRAVDASERDAARRDGRAALPEAAQDRAMSVLNAFVPPGASRRGLRPGELGPREVEILTLVGNGRDDAEVADALIISARAASIQVANIKAKLGVADRSAMAHRAQEIGLVTADPA